MLHGEIDAAAATGLGEYVERYTSYCEWLVLDLSGLDFTATAILSALQAINDRCATVGISWRLVSGPALVKVLRSCESGSALPINESLAEALAAVIQQRYRHLRLR